MKHPTFKTLKISPQAPYLGRLCAALQRKGKQITNFEKTHICFVDTQLPIHKRVPSGN